MYSKSSLAITLSKLDVFSSPDIKLEQYSTDSEIAADIIWNAHMIDSFEGKTVADLGCGTGILGIGALLLGAKKVFFVDRSIKAIEILKKNLKALEFSSNHYVILNVSIEKFFDHTDMILMNPPFGTKIKHADKEFLEKAFTIAKITYSLHKTSTQEFLKRISSAFKTSITHTWNYAFPLKATARFHTKKKVDIAVSCLRFEAKPF